MYPQSIISKNKKNILKNHLEINILQQCCCILHGRVRIMAGGGGGGGGGAHTCSEDDIWHNDIARKSVISK